jgi:hypothetical protein
LLVLPLLLPPTEAGAVLWKARRDGGGHELQRVPVEEKEEVELTETASS